MGEMDEEKRMETLEALKALAGLAAMAGANRKAKQGAAISGLAELLFEQYTELCKVGFSEDHAFELLMVLMKHGLQ